MTVPAHMLVVGAQAYSERTTPDPRTGDGT